MMCMGLHLLLSVFGGLPLSLTATVTEIALTEGQQLWVMTFLLLVPINVRLSGFETPGVDFINRFAPYTQLLRRTPNF